MKRGLLLSHHLRSSSISDSFYHKSTVVSRLLSFRQRDYNDHKQREARK